MLLTPISSLYIELSGKHFGNFKISIVACVYDQSLLVHIYASEMKCHQNGTHFGWSVEADWMAISRWNSQYRLRLFYSKIWYDCILGVLLDCSLNMTQYISPLVGACYFHLWLIWQVNSCLNEICLLILIQALIVSRLDYCNSVLSGLLSLTL